MVDIPLSRSDYARTVAKESRIITRNRYFEQNPVLTDQGAALISRPGLKRWQYLGNDGPVRGIYSQPGSFADALFVVSEDEIFRIEVDGSADLIYSGLTSPLTSSVSMAATSNIGETPEFLFIADGTALYVYLENGYANGIISGSPANNDGVRIGDIYYKFTNASVDAGTPDGTVVNPWLVALGTADTDAWLNFGEAVSGNGVPGTSYSTALEPHPNVITINIEAGSVGVRSTLIGALGNSTVTTETGGSIAWSQPTLTDGGQPNVTLVQTPDDVGIISVGYIASYVVCIPAQGQGVNGRFYWIDPGETIIDPLDFATAERAPDPIFEVVVFGDQFWLPGSNTTEVWYFSGNADAPVLRLQGIVFDRGTIEGTAVQIADSMIIVDKDGGVFQVGGGLKRISRPDIEQRIREAVQRLAFG